MKHDHKTTAVRENKKYINLAGSHPINPHFDGMQGHIMSTRETFNIELTRNNSIGTKILSQVLSNLARLPKWHNYNICLVIK